MKKILLCFSFFIFHFSSINAQDTLVSRSGRKVACKIDSVGKKKVTYIIPPDSVKKTISTWRVECIIYSGGTQLNFNPPFDKKVMKPSTTEFYLSVDGGFNVPFGDYHDAIAGTDFDVRATYFFYNHIGVSMLVGEDLNASGLNYIANNYWGGFYIFHEYLAGLCYRNGGRPNYPFVDFIGLLGVCTASNPTYEQGGGTNGLTVTTPGNGSGLSGYIGMNFTSSSNHVCSFTFGLGCLGAFFHYSNYTSSFTTYNPYTNVTSNATIKSDTKMNLGLVQMHFAINFRLKKSDLIR